MNIKKTRIIRVDTKLKTRMRLSNINAASPCPTLTISDLSQDFIIPGTTAALTCDISGGTTPYTYTGIVSGTAPSGMSISMIDDDTLRLRTVGVTNTEFGTYTFTVAVTDANGCPGTKEFTVYVYAKYSNSSPIPINGSSAMTIAVDLNAIIGVDTAIVSAEINVTKSDLNNLSTPFQLSEPSELNIVNLINNGEVSGSNFTNTIMTDDGLVAINSGTAPYTDSFYVLYPGNINDSFYGFTTSGNWKAYVIGTSDGTIDSIILIFKPL